MDDYLVTTFHQWDVQEQERVAREQEQRETEAHRKLSNLYLRIERGDIPLTITTANTLRILLSQAYPRWFDDRSILEHWMDEFTKLEGWYDV
jgi:hypothetical protein